MFTGIIADLGCVRQIKRRRDEADLEISTAFDLKEIAIGDSIAVNGACLTVTEKKGGDFLVYVSGETLSRTNLQFLKAGHRVNLEKSLRLNDFLGGHLVMGHADGLGRIVERRSLAGSTVFGIEAPDGLGSYLVEKGSVAVDGISLTVNECIKNRFYVNVIPHTLATTTLGLKNPGDRVNIETDIIAKYVEKLLSRRTGGIDRGFLEKHGFVND